MTRRPRSGWLALTTLALACQGPRAQTFAETETQAAGSATRASPPPPSTPPPSPPPSSGAPPAPAAPVPSVALVAPTNSPRRPGAYANLDPNDDFAVGPPEAIADCDAELASAGVTYRPAKLPVHRQGKLTCGAPQVVAYVRGPTGITYEPQPLLTCGMALALASFERIVQEEAKRVFSVPVVRVQQLGTYNCRGIVRFKGVVSEHSYANAIDLAKFVLKNGKTVSVLADFDMSDGPPARPGGDFLRAVSRRAQDEDVFSNVLTAYWDAAHENHFHLDLARYRVNGVRPQRP